MPAERQLREARLTEARLEDELAAARQRTLELEQRIAVERLAADIGHDATVQEAVGRLAEARHQFEASLTPPDDFDPDADGAYEDTDDFGDIRPVDRAVDAELVSAVQHITAAASPTDPGFVSGMRLLCSVTHYVARVSEMVDDGGPKLKEAAFDVVEDLRGDIVEAWREVGAVPGAAGWKPTVLALLQRECGDYYPEAVEEVQGWKA